MSTLFIQQLVTGFSIGAIYALLAVGYALIYSIFKFTNFAFGAIMMCSAYGAYFVVKNLGMTSLAAGLCGAIIIGIIISIITELVAYRSLRRLKASRLFLMISAMGVNILLQNLMTIWMSANLRSLNISLPFRVLAVGKIKIGSIDILSLLVSLAALAVLWIFIERTKYGIAIRASAHDTDTAGLMGINVNKVSLIVFAISGITAAIAGTFTGMKYAVYPTLGAISSKAFISSVIGGLGSLPGAVLGGFILGVLETIISGYISSAYRDLFSFGILIVVLVFLPNGILGTDTSDKL
ncbi:branched-chain amino acid ABC transporter permease [Cloacibacillus porcorum]|jgi:branched-chain amino acid transport system permease protein|uniref:ABC transporter permease n=2 Tax=Cloacibacillus porcorum TaxID=1197717 RepID=A0A1B2I7Z5_9BACT|nr:branched-chain amino acid ABC transporter permease [Cloacibacillus porcorum]ANZ46100.1 ABC transporter permease [Cloacibacillus porcorum]MCC8183687.1 branched-chain amino acid ABC transporter permease [Cloacibacillus porcorum]MCI5866081.1 branched-chain amino acid ABC transporter permease [Cloacibacillus porcorum]MDD7650024.1 branched-chain amino acid ABC transporter permease [Cloacibacillus porcorum]MDY4094217.1 branched-chain amino acid ABC transporter permease [Cloacibacillus porcorum]